MTKAVSAEDTAPAQISFLERAAHDIRGPAGVTLGALSELEQSLGAEITPAQSSLLSMARRGMKRVLAVADQLTGVVDEESAGVPSEVASTAATVLIVDDDPDSSELFALIVERAGFHPMVASDLLQAREILSNHQVSALVVDLNLPDGCGMDLMTHAGASQLKARIIVSGQADAKTRSRSTANGFHDHFVKPIDGERIVALIRRLLAAA